MNTLLHDGVLFHNIFAYETKQFFERSNWYPVVMEEFLRIYYVVVEGNIKITYRETMWCVGWVHHHLFRLVFFISFYILQQQNTLNISDPKSVHF